MKFFSWLFSRRGQQAGAAGTAWVGTGAIIMGAVCAGVIVTAPVTAGGGTCNSPTHTSPHTTTPGDSGGYGYAWDVHGDNSVLVNNNVWNPDPSSTTLLQEINACSQASWYLNANISGSTTSPGSIISYPDTEFNFNPGGSPLSSFHHMYTCYAEHHPSGGEWDWAYDTWLNGLGGGFPNIEVMVWNDYTDTSIYPPPGARAVQINGVNYHFFVGGGPNEFIYTQDSRNTASCIDMLPIYQDFLAHPVNNIGGHPSGMSNSSIPVAIEYGVEFASTPGAVRFDMTNATLTVS